MLLKQAGLVVIALLGAIQLNVGCGGNAGKSADGGGTGGSFGSGGGASSDAGAMATGGMARTGGSTGTGGAGATGGSTGTGGAGATGGSTGGGGSQGLCQQIGAALCTKACACRDGAACAMSQDGLTIDFDSEADCRALFVTFGCSMGDGAAYNNATACLPLAQAATCSSTGPEGAVSFPADMACQSPN